MTIRKLIPLIALACMARLASANDMSIQAVGGTAVPVVGKNPQIRMVSENVQLDLMKDSYQTKVDFVFANSGGPVRVAMGFPERGYGTDNGPSKGYILGFTTTVDGKSVTARRLPAPRGNADYTAYWTKSVDFGKNQVRHIHVEYRSPYGGGINGTRAQYDFTGRNWRGDVEKSVLVVTRHPGAPNLTQAELNGRPMLMTGPPSARACEWKNWQAEGHFAITERAMVNHGPGSFD